MDALRVAKVERVVLERTTRAPPHTRVHVEGTLHLTPHHLIFWPSAAPTVTSPPRRSSVALPSETAVAAARVSVEKTSPRPSVEGNTAAQAAATATKEVKEVHEEAQESKEVWIPYPTINVLQRLPQAPSGRYPLLVGTKTFDTYTFLFERDREGGAEDVWQSVRDCAVTQNVEQLYAFFYTLPKSPITPKAERTALPDAGTSSTSTSTATNPLDIHSPLGTPTEEEPSLPPPAPAEPAVGWASYNPRTEFARQGVGSRTKAWRFTDINRDYSFSPTYPSKLVVPTRISDTLLTYAAKYRSKARIPALSYLHWANHASITRSSQPMIGIKNTRSPQDERLVECIFTSHLSPDTAFTPPLSSSMSSSASSLPSVSSTVYGATPTNLIIDARPTANAMANKAKGAGTENMDWYKCGKKQHLGIDNIHVMRNSLKAVCEALAEADAAQLPVDSNKLRRSNWIKHISGILDGSLTIIKNIHIYSSHVLIHCSDGWDRTSQLSAIAQLCLDPYFRTLDGFKVLIEKDWLSFGHMFLQRSGHLSSDKLFTATPDNLDADEESDDDFGVAVKGVQAFFGNVSKQFQSNSHLKEVSPVFHQFLDCVRQIQRQFPERFEFNEDYLIDLHYHLYACQFGTFMFDSERQRRVVQGKNKKPYTEMTVSAWEWFDLPAQRKRYLNPDYKPELDDRTLRTPDADMGVLLPDPKDVTFWHRLFKRSDDETNPPQSRFLADAVIVPEEKAGSQLSATPSSSTSATPSPRPSTTRLDSSRETTTTASESTSPGTASATSPASGLGLSAASLSSPFARIAKPQGGGGGWNWSQLSNGISTGALSAFNQIKASASDAISQLRENADDEMWGSSSSTQTAATYAPGTGIGEGRHPTGTLPRTSLRIASEANPWSVDPPSTILAAEKPKTSTTVISSTTVSSAVSVSPAAPTPKTADTWATASPKRQTSVSSAWNTNPWGDDSVPRGLGELSLEDVKKQEEAARLAKTAAADKEAAARNKVKDDEDKALLEAALGGDSKAWDPLGAL